MREAGRFAETSLEVCENSHFRVMPGATLRHGVITHAVEVVMMAIESVEVGGVVKCAATTCMGGEAREWVKTGEKGIWDR